MERRRSKSVSAAPDPKRLEVPQRKHSASSPFTRRRKKSSGHQDLKIALVGSIGVGKSAITVRYLTRRFIGEYEKSSDYKYRHMVTIGEDITHIEILDSKSEKSLSNDVIKWADGICLVYSVTDPYSYWTIQSWKERIEDCKKHSLSEFIVLANKRDLSHSRKVSREEGENLAKQLGCFYFEVSAAEDYDVIRNAFYELYQEIKVRRKSSRSSLLDRMFSNIHIK
ncbi:ras-related and estrogen-regulated growth inhibitor-like [Ptychodera flava]|uniref:ras-related and estrogen-regulated growth inhibitor-like n=1 Tax=Ptychodera flava TaxID=63121 RepID=UPI00396A1579